MTDNCIRYQQRDKPIHRVALLNESDYTIIAIYQVEYRVIVNYYRHAYNLHRLHTLKKAMEGSLTKTLAAKHHTSVGSIYRSYRTPLKVDGRTYQGLQVTMAREGKKPLVATWGGIPLKWDIKATLDDQPPHIWHDRSELEQRLLAQVSHGMRNEMHFSSEVALDGSSLHPWFLHRSGTAPISSASKRCDRDCL